MPARYGRFASYVIDTELKRVWKNGQECKCPDGKRITPLATRILIHLMKSSGELVRGSSVLGLKEPGDSHSLASDWMTKYINRLKRCMGEELDQYIENIGKKRDPEKVGGYCFVGRVTWTKKPPQTRKSVRARQQYAPETIRGDSGISRIFGDESELKIVHSELTLAEPVQKAIDEYFPPEKSKHWKTYFLTPTNPEYRPGIEFRGTHVACVCEVRGAGYISECLAKLNRGTKILSATSPKAEDLFGQSLIALGAKSNQITDQILRKNSLVDIKMDRQDDIRFMSKSRKILTPQRDRNIEDYGLIVKISPRYHPERACIACAGLSEFGTSGAAHFLAKEWPQLLAKMSSRKTNSFACIVKVEARPNRESSAEIFQFAQSQNQWKNYSL